MMDKIVFLILYPLWEFLYIRRGLFFDFLFSFRIQDGVFVQKYSLLSSKKLENIYINKMVRGLCAK